MRREFPFKARFKSDGRVVTVRNAPVEASAILYSARRYGIPLRSLYKAKKFYHVVSYKRGGRWGREGARWYWAYSLPE